MLSGAGGADAGGGYEGPGRWPERAGAMVCAMAELNTAGGGAGRAGALRAALDQCDRPGLSLVDGQVAGVEEIGIRSPLQGRGGAAHVAFVAGLDVYQDVLIVDPGAAGVQLLEAAAGADFRPGSDEQLGLGVGGDDGADVAAVEHGAAVPSGEIALALGGRGADGGVEGDARGDAAGGLALVRGVGEVDLDDIARGPGWEVAVRGAPPGRIVGGPRREKIGKDH